MEGSRDRLSLPPLSLLERATRFSDLLQGRHFEDEIKVDLQRLYVVILSFVLRFFFEVWCMISYQVGFFFGCSSSSWSFILRIFINVFNSLWSIL